NQWFLNAAKLERIRRVWHMRRQFELPPILVTEIDGSLSLIDGHSRAYVAYEQGVRKMNGEFRELSLIEGLTALYELINRNGERNGIRQVSDLADRILSPEEFRLRWVDYCESLPHLGRG